MPQTPERLAASDYAQRCDMDADLAHLRKKVEKAEDAQICYLALTLIVLCICVVALGRVYPGFYRSGGIYMWIALVSACKAIGGVLVSRQQIQLALAILAQRSTTNQRTITTNRLQHP